MIRVLINGANGKMGNIVQHAIAADNTLEVADLASRNDSLVTKIEQSQPDIVIDVTTAEVVYENTHTIIEAGVRPVIGTSGLLPEQVDELKKYAKSHGVGGIIAPNFSIAAVLMMRFAQQAKPYLPSVEIIEAHHQHKVDAPSGTAVKTAQLLAAEHYTAADTKERELIAGARGGQYQDIRIHSLRLPGVVAKQQVIFGTLGETLTIESNTINHQAFIPGIQLACHKALETSELIYGLENIL